MIGPMNKIRAHSAAFATGVALLLGSTALTAPQAAFAQAQTGVVQRIVVQGNERIEQGTVLSYLPIQPGETVDPARLDLALKTLARTDLFADVKIELVGGDLIVKVVENPIINQVVFEGNSALKEDKLKDEVQIRPRGIFTRSKVQADVQRIIELYRRSGRISATVTPKVVELPQKRVDLVFEINEGPKSGVLGVNFLGNSEYSDNDLRDVIVTKESHWYKFLTSNDNYDPDRIEYDREQLRKHYRNRGFFDFRVVASVAELATDKNGFAVTYTIDEGPKYKFGKVTVETELKKLDGNLLAQILPIRTGQLYEDERIEQATDALTFAAGAAGFAFVDVRPRYVPNRETNTVDVVFSVREGPRVYVDRIDIVGNTRTLDYVLRRELEVAEGDAYNRVLVDRSKNRIRSLGFFKDVNIEEIPGAQPDRTALRVKVEEQPTGELSFSAGYSSVDKLVLDVGITERNFRGRGQNLRARVSVGSLRQQIDFGFTEPRFLGRDLRAGLDLYSYRYDLSDYAAYDTKSTGGTLRLGFPLTQNASMSLRYQLRQDEVSVDNSLCVNGSVSDILCLQRGSYMTSLIGYGLRLDKRNDPIQPTRGWFADLNQDLAGFGGDVKYLKTEADAGWYWGFNKDFIFSATGSAGYIEGWGGDDIRINDRFYKGGTSFRGFEIAGIGPRDTTNSQTNSLGAKLYAIGTVELTIPTFLPDQYGIKAAVFSDFGTAGQLDDVDRLGADGQPNLAIKDGLGLRASAGLSIDWKSPMGPIRFDFSRILAKENYDRTETFRFSTSTRF
ncbi:outer membrane protein assembly factor BamA [Caulobacter sp. Root655]|uniref:outer membrane protein assembly factor BamA n=1 Tax=Caulobacter sp. Root655 TaxID=1736578 RepID=UPI0006FFA604|nr:outer membrane protein assembly factor BamA [Caulobacter sp. Root655]KRA65127.1 outer membrane protein assembly factor BamA [Caulobacter sp. Root655]